MLLADKEAARFFRRSYMAVDGLWFMQVEKLLGTEAALDTDVAVWQVMPKIQARLLKEMTGAERGLRALQTCLTAKLRWEGYAFENAFDEQKGVLTIAICQCPWHQLLVKSHRQHLAEPIAARICSVEYAIWANEFGPGLGFELVSSPGSDAICRENGTCLLRFRQEI